MKIECVIWCNNYSDFLNHTLPYNKHYFDNVMVVTSTKDEKTIKICDINNIMCIQLDDDVIDQGVAINEGLKNLKYNEWVVRLDADIWLPQRTRHILNNLNNQGVLEKKKIYGIDRLMCNSYEDWLKFKDNPQIHEGWVYMHLNAFEMGVRLVAYNSSGYIPIGFFQLWNVEATGINSYPVEHGEVDRMDVIHAKKWDRKNRVLLPEIVGVHLDSKKSEMGENWDNGRSTPFFGFEK